MFRRRRDGDTRIQRNDLGQFRVQCYVMDGWYDCWMDKGVFNTFVEAQIERENLDAKAARQRKRAKWRTIAS